MEIRSDYVGTLLQEYRKEITWRETMTGMVIPGSEIHIQLAGREAGREGNHLFPQVLNQEGKKAISEGVITLRAPLGQGLVGTSG